MSGLPRKVRRRPSSRRKKTVESNIKAYESIELGGKDKYTDKYRTVIL